MANKVKKSTGSRAKTPESPSARRKFMRSYTTDAQGNKVLIGLTLKETVEYEEYRDSPIAERKAGKKQDRFQELHSKHAAARQKMPAAKHRARAEKAARK